MQINIYFNKKFWDSYANYLNKEGGKDEQGLVLLAKEPAQLKLIGCTNLKTRFQPHNWEKRRQICNNNIIFTLPIRGANKKGEAQKTICHTYGKSKNLFCCSKRKRNKEFYREMIRSNWK